MCGLKISICKISNIINWKGKEKIANYYFYRERRLKRIWGKGTYCLERKHW